MKKIILPALTIMTILWSCSTAYKTTSTPDDVYYSPAREVKESGQDRYDEYTTNSEDNYLRMRVRNRYQWDAIDDYSYWNDPRYDFGYSCMPSREVLLNPYNPYLGIGYNMYYSPWYYSRSPYTTVVFYKTPNAYYGNTSKTNLTAYRNGNYNNTNNKPTFGSLFKQAFSNNNNYYNPTNNNSNTRTFNSGTVPSNNVGGRSGGFNSSGSSASTPRPSRPH